MNEDTKFLKELTTRGLYSTDMRGKPMTVDSFYNAISIINNKSEQYQNYAHLGFYKVGQLLANQTNKTLEIIEVQSGTYLGEDDIVRFEDIYGRVKK